MQEGLSKGRREFAARSLLTVSRVRKIDVPATYCRRISAEKDVTRLEHWLERAATAHKIDEVFAEPS